MRQISVSFSEAEIKKIADSADKNHRSLSAEIRFNTIRAYTRALDSDPDQDININLINQDQENARAESELEAVAANGTDATVIYMPQPKAELKKNEVLRISAPALQKGKAEHSNQSAMPTPIQAVIPEVIKADERAVEKEFPGQILTDAFISKAARLYSHAAGFEYHPDAAAVWQANHFAKCAKKYLHLEQSELEKFLFDRMLAIVDIRKRQHTTTATWASCFGHSYLKDFFQMAAVVTGYRNRRAQESAAREERIKAQAAPPADGKKQTSFKAYLEQAGHSDPFIEKLNTARKERDEDGRS